MDKEYRLARAKNLPEYRFLTSIPDKPVEEVGLFTNEQDPLLAQIFAPDPVSGFPRSDIYLELSTDTAPEVARYIQDKLMRPVGSAASFDDSIESADLALEMVKRNQESVSDYADRLRAIVESSAPIDD